MKLTQGLGRARVISRAWPKGGITKLSTLYREPTKVKRNIEVDSIPKDHRVKLYPHPGKRAYIINRVSSGSVVYPDADWSSNGRVSDMQRRDFL